MGKKGDMSINVIIVAVLALIVLVVLIFIFNGKMSIFGKGASSCPGDCVSMIGKSSETQACEDYKPSISVGSAQKKYSYNPGAKCQDKYVCCVGIEI